MIRILIADESTRVTDNIKRRLLLEEDMVVVGTAKDGEYALQEALRLQPDVALIDASLPGLDGVQTTEMLAQHLPRTSVIMLSMEGENEAYRHAMLAGAREFLEKPFTGDTLVAAIRRVHAFEQHKVLPVTTSTANTPTEAVVASGKVLTVIAGSGGVGKSTVAANLSVDLAKTTGRRIALVDLSLQFGDISAMLNLHSDRTIADLAANDAIADREVVGQALVEGPEGIRVLLAPPTPKLSNYVMTPHLRALMDELKRTFDYIVIDAPGYFNEITLDAIEMTDAIVVITDFSTTAIKNTASVLSVLDVLKFAHERIHLIANHHRGVAPTLDTATAESQLGHSIALEIPFEPDTVGESVIQGVPFVVSHPESTASRCIAELALLVAPNAHDTDSDTNDGEADNKKPHRILGFARN